MRVFKAERGNSAFFSLFSRRLRTRARSSTVSTNDAIKPFLPDTSSAQSDSSYSTAHTLSSLRQSIESVVHRRTPSDFLPPPLPPSRFYDANRFSSASLTAKRIRTEKLFNDADEILRKKDSADTQRYMNIVYNETSDTDQISHILRKLLSMHHREMENSGFSAVSDCWAVVLNKLPEEELGLLWSSGLVDLTVIEELLKEEKGRFDGGDAVEEEGSTDALQVYLRGPVETKHQTLIEENMNQFRRVQSSSALTRGIREAALSDDPTADLAPALAKVLEKNYEEISKDELEALHRFEEKKCVHLIAREHDTTYATCISESTLNRALHLSNKFLASAAHCDSELSDSLSVLERIKRRAILDPVFQEATQLANEMEEKESKRYTNDCVRERRGFPEKRKWQAGYKGERNPLERKSFVTDVPFFYEAKHNVVPPQGRYSLPSPRIPREVRKMLHRRMRHQHKRFSR